MQCIVTYAVTNIGRTKDASMSQAGERDFYTVAQAAKYLGVSPSTVWRWIEADRLEAYRVGPKNIRIKKEDLARVVQPTRSHSKEEPKKKQLAAVTTTLTIRPLSPEERWRGLQAVREARELRQRIRARRGGRPLPSSWELIREAREERTSRL
jgi:excisionase family DNA binding protein